MDAEKKMWAIYDLWVIFTSGKGGKNNDAPRAFHVVYSILYTQAIPCRDGHPGVWREPRVVCVQHVPVAKVGPLCPLPRAGHVLSNLEAFPVER